ncbi:MAG TPA: ATP-binding protein [Spirochaetota bacterium]|nr:ATP-binding protein [Spirochaetota bacterium]
MPQSQKNKKDSSALPGFRLHRFEVLNWGTFDKKIWALETAGENSLLTGDIGSGKSTLIDALTTLLVQPGRITYNKAAGAEGRERSLADYILGHYKKEKDAEGLQAARSVSLREKGKTLTVILGRFCDSNSGEKVTLVQVFWLKEGTNQPDRFYAVSSDPLSIEKDILIPGADPLSLKKHLRTRHTVEIYDSYSTYSAEFRRRMAIRSSQAIDLLYQTVSMKSIGNLTDFVRSHMLDEFSIQERISELCRNFTNLNQAHEAVLKARRQIETLTPMVRECDSYDEGESAVALFRTSRDSLHSYMAGIEQGLIEAKIIRLEDENRKVSRRIEKVLAEASGLETAREKVRRDIEDNGGRRLAELEREIASLEEERRRRKAKSAAYAELASLLELDQPLNEATFFENLKIAGGRIGQCEEKQREAGEEELAARMKLRTLQDEYDSIKVELESLRGRKTNIPARLLDMRTELCRAINVVESRLPFAGELIEVRDKEEEWEGAIERVLHNFGQSILVPDDLYGDVTGYAEKTDLRGRLVYYRVKDKRESRAVQTVPGQLAGKIRIRSDNEFYEWIDEEIRTRFDYMCCETLDDFRRHPKALTHAGQIKSGGVRHEKDDRHSIHDRSRYILGWKNEQKIALLEHKLKSVESEGAKLTEAVKETAERISRLRELRDAGRDMIAIKDFSGIDWQWVAMRIEEHVSEMKEITGTSDILYTLKEQLSRIEKGIVDNKTEYGNLNKKQGEIEKEIENLVAALENAVKKFSSIEQAVRDENFPRIDAIRNREFPEKKITLQNSESFQKDLREYIQRQMDNINEQNRRHAERIVKQMQSYRDAYAIETSEIDASIEAAHEYRRMLSELVSENLPRHEEDFKRLLREGTIQDIALFQNRMNKEVEEIKSKIAVINGSLHGIEYNPGSYIMLIGDRTTDQEIRQFQEDLRLCLGETLSGDEGDAYTEEKFRQVKALIDRFVGRDGFVETDRRWTAKVTDVRNWFIFSASERWLEDDSEREFYSDSSGKSGGQKEKLAYTILAAALAFQFSLGQEGLWNRSFRFVMIDEAFGRGSDESARYGLELFSRLQLQLLIVTPLQKIHVIENYVKTVHFAYQDENRSHVGNMTIEEYRSRKAEVQAGK